MTRILRRIWLWPSIIGLATGLGLVSALLGDGIWDDLSWIALGLPVVVVIRASSRQRWRPRRRA